MNVTQLKILYWILSTSRSYEFQFVIYAFFHPITRPFLQHIHTISTYSAVALSLYHLFLVSLSQLMTSERKCHLTPHICSSSYKFHLIIFLQPISLPCHIHFKTQWNDTQMKIKMTTTYIHCTHYTIKASANFSVLSITTNQSYSDNIWPANKSTLPQIIKRYSWFPASSVTFLMLCWTHILCWSSVFSL